MKKNLNPHALIGRLTAAFLTLAVLTGCFRRIERDVAIQVPKMQSQECFSVIQEALRPLDGIISATADIPNHTLTVRYDSEKLGIKNIEFVIAGAGFAANELPANEDARKKLPEACR